MNAVVELSPVKLSTAGVVSVVARAETSCCLARYIIKILVDAAGADAKDILGEPLTN